MDNNQKRTMLALILSGVVLFTWQSFFAPKQAEKSFKEEFSKEKTTEVKNVSNNSNENKPNNVVNIPKTQDVKYSTTTLVSSNGEYSFSVASDMSLSDMKGFHTKMTTTEFSGYERIGQFGYVDQSGNFQNFNFGFQEIANAPEVIGFDSNVKAKVTVKLEDSGQLLYSIQSENPLRLAIRMSSKEGQSDNRTFRQFVNFSSEVNRINVEDDESLEGNFKWLGLDFNHHNFLNIFKEKVSSRLQTFEDGTMLFTTNNPNQNYNGYIIYSLKDLDYLSSFKDQLDLSIDFGIFGILAVPILKGLKFLYSYLGNYGFAIIILTILIRFATFPLQFKSFKSMKKMQKVQPELTKLREKYKDNPQEMQKRTMELFKRSGANPLGGCFPMLLQIPIFIAFYQAISNSVELVGSPFAFWLFDLSSKDPYYVLPVLMGVTMFFQTKLNPSTTADPNQQKIMYIMPLVFCFMMKDLPAGLNLYFFISNLVGIGQQVLVYRMVD